MDKIKKYKAECLIVIAMAILSIYVVVMNEGTILDALSLDYIMAIVLMYKFNKKYSLIGLGIGVVAFDILNIDFMEKEEVFTIISTIMSIIVAYINVMLDKCNNDDTVDIRDRIYNVVKYIYICGMCVIVGIFSVKGVYLIEQIGYSSIVVDKEKSYIYYLCGLIRDIGIAGVTNMLMFDERWALILASIIMVCSSLIAIGIVNGMALMYVLIAVVMVVCLIRLKREEKLDGSN